MKSTPIETRCCPLKGCDNTWIEISGDPLDRPGRRTVRIEYFVPDAGVGIHDYQSLRFCSLGCAGKFCQEAEQENPVTEETTEAT